MPLVGVICPFDDTNQSFETCIGCHQRLSKERNCNVPTAALIDARDNATKRVLAGVSASTLLSCVRHVALQETYDYYEAPQSMWSKYRGTLTHLMLEEERNDDLDGVIQEERFVRYILIDGEPFRVSGQMDKVYTKQGVLIDVKSKHTIPTKIIDRYVRQLSVYRWILADGEHVTREGVPSMGKVSFDIHTAGVHFVTFNHKPEAAWSKVAYPLLPLEETEAFILERATAIKRWQDTRELPECNDLEPSKFWPCDCQKLEQHLESRGITLDRE